ncbi:hypothetical protein NL108_010513 [Boleophthalmus pectinirostris]|nr:hypothetical protein NL108_010513 [Boleophthalmus pectinirostris]
MAEIGKGVTAGKLASNVQKRLTRAQEKVLQKLGKADETRDVVFEEMVANFNKQMNEGTKLQKDLKSYLAAVKAMHDASRRLQDCLADMYEPEWFGKEEMDALAEEMIEKELDNNLEDTDTLWLDFHQSLTDKSVVTVDTYLGQFPDIKARIAKRDRKMVDFDSARHHFANLQKGKKKDEAKIAKAEEELGRAQKIFEELNVELQDELPVLWDSRVGVYVNTFQTMAKNQEKFHREMGKLSENLNDIMTKLEEQRELNEEANHSESAASAPKRPGAPPTRPPPTLSPASEPRGDSPLDEEASVNPASQAPSWDAWQDSADQDYSQTDPQTTEDPQSWDQTPDYTNPDYTNPDYTNPDYTNPDYTNPDWGQSPQSYTESAWDQDQGAVTNGSDGEMPPGFLYKVKAVHDYAATDGDELELKVGDMVLVLAFDNPDEQDDGWLLGLKESHWVQKKDLKGKGVFPENFTTKV